MEDGGWHRRACDGRGGEVRVGSFLFVRDGACAIELRLMGMGPEIPLVLRVSSDGSVVFSA
jgi:hypothetical protein